VSAGGVVGASCSCGSGAVAPGLFFAVTISAPKNTAQLAAVPYSRFGLFVGWCIASSAPRYACGCRLVNWAIACVYLELLLASTGLGEAIPVR
jgi:hypothetical protein